MEKNSQKLGLNLACPFIRGTGEGQKPKLTQLPLSKIKNQTFRYPKIMKFVPLETLSSLVSDKIKIQPKTRRKRVENPT